MSVKHYILDGKFPVVEPDLMTWSQWFETADRVVKQEWVENVRVSTVFLGLDHNFNFGGDRTPVLFETMLFTNRADLNLALRRYKTWEQAEAGHNEIVKQIYEQSKKS